MGNDGRKKKNRTKKKTTGKKWALEKKCLLFEKVTPNKKLKNGQLPILVGKKNGAYLPYQHSKIVRSNSEKVEVTKTFAMAISKILKVYFINAHNASSFICIVKSCQYSFFY